MNSITIGINVIKRTLHDINSINFLIISPILAGLIVVVMLGGSGAIDIGIANIAEENNGFVEYLNNNEKYNVQLYNEDEIQAKVQEGEVKAGLMFSNSKKIKLVALKNSSEIQELRGIVEMYMLSSQEFSQNQIVNENENMESKMAIGMMTMFMIVFAGNSIALLLEDKKLKTFTRAFCAPIRGYEAVLGYLMANILLGMVQITVFLVFTTYIFSIEWGIPLGYIFIMLIVYLVGAIGLAIGFAGFISDSKKYNMVLMLIGVITSFIGGSFFPIDNLNSFIKGISNFTPQKWMIDSIDILAKGGSIGDVQINILILLLFGVVLFTFGVKTLRPNPEDL